MSSTTRRTGILNVLSYCAVVFVGVALLLSWLFDQIDLASQLVGALKLLAEVMAYIVVACHSFGYARARGTWWLVAWAVAVVLIVVFLVLGSRSLFN